MSCATVPSERRWALGAYDKECKLAASGHVLAPCVQNMSSERGRTASESRAPPHVAEVATARGRTATLNDELGRETRLRRAGAQAASHGPRATAAASASYRLPFYVCKLPVICMQ